MIRKALLAAAVAMSAAPAGAQQPAPPKLLVVISVDQLSADLFDEYRPQFTGGFARLATGTVFRNGYQSHAATETCPGHSTILTGAHPARTGIVANGWQNSRAPRADKAVYCAEDESVPGTTSREYAVSPVHLKVRTLGEYAKAAWRGSRNVAVAGKDRAAVMMGGHVADQRWYWDGKTFATDLKSAPIPQSVTRAKAAAARLIAAPSAPLQPPPSCALKARPYTLPGRTAPVGNGQLARPAGEAGPFRASPQFDATVLALAAALVQEMRLGAGAAPDVLSIGLSATDYVGHNFGPGGQEMCLQLLALDRDLGDFLKMMDSTGVDYAVALAAELDVLDIPERLRAGGVADAAWIDHALAPKAMREKLRTELNMPGPMIHAEGPVGDVYLDPALSPADRVRAMKAAVALYTAHPQIAAVFTKDDLAKMAVPTGSPAGWSVAERVRASFDAERSGDIYVVPRPHVMPILDPASYVATHGSPWDYDRRVPIIFWRPGFRGATIDTAAETTDIMPTLAGLIGLRIAPGAVDGRCLEGTPAFCGPR